MVLLRSVVLWGFVIFCQNVNSAMAAHFCYKDQDCSPRTWPGQCQSGVRQSPINLPAHSSYFSATTDLHLSSCYSQRQTFILENNGHTAQASLKADQTSTCTMTGGLLEDTYTFAQMHFHWGSTDNHGSEHSVNGQKYEMEGHMVHYKSNFDNVSHAVASTEPDALTVVAVFFKLSPDDNPALDPIIAALGSVRTAETESHGSNLVLANFLEINSSPNVEVIQYDGSLTTPGCNPVVLWNLFRRTLPISRAQLKAFRSIKDDEKRPLEDNDRPLQEGKDIEIRYYNTSIEAHQDRPRESIIFRPFAFLAQLLRLVQ